MAWYGVEITIGPYSWSIEHDDTADPDNPGPLGGLSFGWSMPDGDLAPVQPSPMDVSLGLVVADIDDFDEVDIGTPVAVEVKLDPAGPVLFSFFGRVADQGATPHPKGMLLSVAADDYTADERPIGLSDWPSTSVSFRFDTVWEEAGAGTVPAMALDDADNFLPARSASGTTLPAYVEEVLPTLIGAMPGSTAYGRYILSPLITGGLLDPDQNFALDAVLDEMGDLPAEFAVTDGGYGLTFDPDPAALVLEAGYVQRSARWRRRKFGAFNLILMTRPDNSVVNYGPNGLNSPVPDPAIVATLSTPFDDTFLPNLLYYFDAHNATNRWEIESFTYELSEHIDAGLDPADLEPGWMPVHDAAEGDASRAACYLRPVVVTGIPEHQNPASVDTYAGQLRSARLNIARGKVTVTFAARRSLPNPDPDEALTPAGLAASALSAVTVADLDPGYTVYDYRLAMEAA